MATEHGRVVALGRVVLERDMGSNVYGGVHSMNTYAATITRGPYYAFVVVEVKAYDEDSALGVIAALFGDVDVELEEV